jgi:Flp pilus assembly pilin Flp
MRPVRPHPHVLTRTATARPRQRRGRHDDRGQTTAEYALVIMAAGAIAIGVIAWANGTGSFTGLFESVIEDLTGSL